MLEAVQARSFVRLLPQKELPQVIHQERIVHSARRQA